VRTDTAGLAIATDDPIERIGVERAEEAMATADILLWLGDEAPPPHPAALWLYPRADARPAAPADRIAVSATSGAGMAGLWQALADKARMLLPREDRLAVNQRQRALLDEAAVALAGAQGESDLLIVAEQLRLARRAIDRITGATDVEAMLDALFGRFCIGK